MSAPNSNSEISNNNNSNNNKRKAERFFTVVESNVALPDGTTKTGGRYASNDPNSAAKKASRQLFNHTSGDTVTFTMRETTRTSVNAQYPYTAKRVKLAEPVKYKIGDKEIVNEFNYVVKSLRKGGADVTEKEE
jgi:hypothetical protein